MGIIAKIRTKINKSAVAKEIPFVADQTKPVEPKKKVK